MRVLLVFIGIVYFLAEPSQQYDQVLHADFEGVDTEKLEGLIHKSSKQTIIETIRQEGYSVENHYVTTPDGYILNLHRIPKGKTGRKNNKVVYLQHGLLESSFDWIVAGPGKSLGYILADEGYDVWMGNSRGNAYCRNHTTLNPDRDSEFWHFSWHEIGKIDLPTCIDYVLKQTKVEKVYYVGHSQGNTVFYVMASTRPEYNEKIKVQVSLAPIGFMNHMTSPLLKIMAFWDKTISLLLVAIGVDEFLPSESFLATTVGYLCKDGLSQVLCKNALFAICGFSNEQMNTTLLPTIMAHVPAGASTRQLLHYTQEIKSGKFCQYDFGKLANYEKYGQFSPPDYDLSRVTAPVYLIYSQNDWLAGEVDVKRLSTGLGNCVRLSLVPDEKFNHLDFLYGIDAPTLIYNQVIQICNSN